MNPGSQVSHKGPKKSSAQTLLSRQFSCVSHRKIKEELIENLQKPGKTWIIFPPGQSALSGHFEQNESEEFNEKEPIEHKEQVWV